MIVVIDTNVLVSALLTRNPESPTRRIYDYVDSGDIMPLYNDEIIREYKEVLAREKFHFASEDVEILIGKIERCGINSERVAYDEFMKDEKDRVFYEVALSVDGSFLVTGNIKHFPAVPRVVTPAELIELLEMQRGRYD